MAMIGVNSADQRPSGALQAAEKVPMESLFLHGDLIKDRGMRGDEQKQTAMYSYATLTQRIPEDHPVRGIRVLVDRALARMDAQLAQLYSNTGRPSIAPERLLRATLLMVLYPGIAEAQGGSAGE